jgi:hypothetical protein
LRWASLVCEVRKSFPRPAGSAARGRATRATPCSSPPAGDCQRTPPSVQESAPRFAR